MKQSSEVTNWNRKVETSLRITKESCAAMTFLIAFFVLLCLLQHEIYVKSTANKSIVNETKFACLDFCEGEGRVKILVTS